MTTVRLRLPKVNYEISLPRQRILDRIPNSILASALANEPDVENIDIEQDFVTPGSLQVLSQILDTGSIPEQISNRSELDQVGRYLGVDQLRIAAIPSYHRIQTGHGNFNLITLLNPKNLAGEYTYRDVSGYALSYDDPVLLQYIFSVTRASDHKTQDEETFKEAIREGRYNLLSVLEQRGIDISSGQDVHLINAVIHGDAATVSWFLQHPSVNPAAQNNLPLIEAIKRGNWNVIQLLLHTGRVNPALPNGDPLIAAIQANHPMIVRYLLTDKRIDLNAGDPLLKDRVLMAAVDTDNPDMLKLIISDPRIDFADTANVALLRAVNNHQTKSLEFLLQQPEVNANDQNGLVLNHAIDRDDPEFTMINLLIRNGHLTPETFMNGAIHAIETNHIEVLKYILQILPELDANYLLLTATESGQYEMVELIMRQRERQLEPDTIYRAAEMSLQFHDDSIYRLLSNSRHFDPYVFREMTQNRSYY